MHPRHAALLLLATALGGRLLLQWRGAPHAAPGEVAFKVAAPTDLAAQRRAAVARTAEVGEGETIDVDRAGAGELARLPGVGPALARRIVAEREHGGMFGGSPCLDARVAGVGAGFLRRAGPHLTFSGPPCAQAGGPDRGRAAGNADTAAVGCPDVVEINVATKAQLECLPGVGAARAESILALRARKGAFGSVAELRGVRGLTQRLLKGLEGRVSTARMP